MMPVGHEQLQRGHWRVYVELVVFASLNSCMPVGDTGE